MTRAATPRQIDIVRAVRSAAAAGLPYIDRFEDRHGKVRFYFRRPKGPRTPLPDPGSPEFEAAYQAALEARVKPPRPAQKGEMVYFIRSANRVKIGYSRNVAARLATMQTASAARLRVYYATPGGVERERGIHALFEKHRIKGEWFTWSPDMADWIAADEADRLRRKA